MRQHKLNQSEFCLPFPLCGHILNTNLQWGTRTWLLAGSSVLPIHNQLSYQELFDFIWLNTLIFNWTGVGCCAFLHRSQSMGQVRPVIKMITLTNSGWNAGWWSTSLMIKYWLHYLKQFSSTRNGMYMYINTCTFAHEEPLINSDYSKLFTHQHQ